MYFQDPSLLAFQARLEKKPQRSNMQTIFRVRKTPRNSQALALPVARIFVHFTL
jgi:hypothetical protein